MRASLEAATDTDDGLIALRMIISTFCFCLLLTHVTNVTIEIIMNVQCCIEIRSNENECKGGTKECSVCCRPSSSSNLHCSALIDSSGDGWMVFGK
jgi:hypothetical protein